MLKQWFFKKKNGYHAQSHHQFIQQGIVRYKHQHPFSERYIVRRRNPLFAEDDHLRSLNELRLPQIWAATKGEEPKLHVQTWCSIVCPQHLTTCCVCKPVLIYCDHCGTSRKNTFDLEWKGSHILRNSETINDPRTPALFRPPTLKVAMASEITSSLDSDHHGPNGNGDEETAYQVHVTNDEHIYEQLIPLEELQSIQLNNENQQPLHFYMNSAFVSEITVQGNIEPFQGRKALGEEIPRLETGHNTWRNQIPEDKVFRKSAINNLKCSHHGPSEKINPSQEFQTVPSRKEVSTDTHGSESNGAYEFSSDSEEMDSLDSLNIDEGMFTPEYMNSAETHSKKINRSSLTKTNVMLLQNDDYVNEAIKDLYRKLAMNRHHVVLHQAMKGTGLHNSLNEYETSIETVSEKSRRSYATLLEEEAKRTNTPPTTYYDNILLRSSPANTVIRGGHFSRMPGNLRLNGPVNVRESDEQLHLETSSGSLAVTSTSNANTATTSSTIEQSREPNQVDAIDPSERTNLKNRQKRFQERNFKDACKIILTTIIGLIAFGVITTLSLRLQ